MAVRASVRSEAGQDLGVRLLGARFERSAAVTRLYLRPR